MKSRLNLVLDIETTGTDPTRHHIVEVGIVAFMGRQEVAAYSELTNPGEDALRDADPKAMAVNGIAPENLKHARSPEIVSEILRAFIRSHRGMIHAFNNEFEMGFLTHGSWNIAGPWGDCVMLAAREVMGKAGALPLFYGKPKFPKLSEAAAFFGVPQRERAHRSLSDARVAAFIRAEIEERRPIEDEVEEMIGDGA